MAPHSKITTLWHNNEQELLALVVLTLLIAHHKGPCNITIYGDNTTAKIVTDKHSSGNFVLDALHQYLAIILRTYNCTIKCFYLEGRLNIVPDHLSRNRLQKARNAARRDELSPEHQKLLQIHDLIDSFTKTTQFRARL